MADPKPKKQPNPYVRFIAVGFQMGATIWLGNLFGEWLDTKYQTTYWENVITLLAVFMSMYLVISQVLKLSKDND
ncbi:AtpZ/AtpI family protein [Olleya aquimaris]|uniref:Putative F0F1-ATPase subunit (Ca2+/Mg2+ transporter) n=1 Tax=Olleya aquimaris TaxID=639310 RepID=A0A327RPE3_9FLAO|nr:AtpZ/AtpI family protein [Olleya aquimaris]RAJ17928.1 putative F0F1-ATPase subunit (Ca2+/Mg2+ transporter) [Olleya aquimaris]